MKSTSLVSLSRSGLALAVVLALGTSSHAADEAGSSSGATASGSGAWTALIATLMSPALVSEDVKTTSPGSGGSPRPWGKLVSPKGPKKASGGSRGSGSGKSANGGPSDWGSGGSDDQHAQGNGKKRRRIKPSHNAPEIDPTLAGGALTLLLGGMAVLTDRRRRGTVPA